MNRSHDFHVTIEIIASNEVTWPEVNFCHILQDVATNNSRLASAVYSRTKN